MAEVTQPVADALEVLGLDLPVSQEQLEIKRKELLHIWDPSRYANLTNNPKKYMQMYKEAEGMTKKIEAAYSLLSSWLASPPNHPPDGPIII
jgi:preprotein translocase subunit Sec63